MVWGRNANSQTASPLSRQPSPPPSSQPHQRRKQEGQLEADPAVGEGLDVVTSLEGRSIQGLAGHASLRIPGGDAGLLCTVMGQQVHQAIVIQILGVASLLVCRRRTVVPEGQGGHIHVRHIKGVRAENRDGDDPLAEGIDGVGIASGHLGGDSRSGSA